jgi:hypothetical protein
VDLIQTLGSKKNPGLGLESGMGLIERKKRRSLEFLWDWIAVWIDPDQFRTELV